MKEVFINQAVKYAASKTSATANTALTPDLLAVGASGIYTIDTAGKPSLVTASNVSSIVSTTGVTKDDVPYVFAQGTATGVYVSKSVKPKYLKRLFKVTYADVTKQVSYVGWNTVSGSLGYPATIVDFTETVIGYQVNNRKSSPIETYGTTSATLRSTYNLYDAASATVTALIGDGFFDANVVSDGVSTAIVATTDFTGTLTFTNGSAGVVVGTSFGGTLLVAGNYLRVTQNAQTGVITVAAATATNSVLYKIVSVVGTTLTLDRPFYGVTTTLSQANAATIIKVGTTTPTNVGIRLVSTDAKEYQQFTLNVGGVINSATITYSVGMNPGSGTPAQMQTLESGFFSASGFWNTADPFLRSPATQLQAVGYDLYFMDFYLPYAGKIDDAKELENYEINVAFPDGSYTTGDNEADFETIVNAAFGVSGTPVALNAVASQGTI